jgi:FHS family L-fucose permease-like MFS transporter
MYWLLMLVGRLLGGVLGTKMSSRTMLTSVCVIAMCFVGAAILMSPEMTASIVGISKDGGLSFEVFDVRLSVLMLVLCGLCTSVMWGAIFSLSVVGLGRYTQVASGIFMVMVCGGGILPMVQGMLVDSMGYLNSFWLVFGLIGYMLFYALVGSRTKKA